MISPAVELPGGAELSTDDRLIIRSPSSPGHYQLDLSLQVYGPDIRKGIIPYIENFGQLYHGKFKQHTWTAKFVQEKKLLLQDMWTVNDDPGFIENIDFKLRQTDSARTLQRWDFPVLLDVRNQSVIWNNGHSRLLASSVCWNHAWDRVDALMFVPEGQDLSAIPTSFQYLDRIHDDQELRIIFGNSMSTDQPWLINAGFETDNNQIIFRLRNVQKHRNSVDNTQNVKHFSAWKAWRAQYSGTDLMISVSVDAISKIDDSSKRWQIKHVGPPPDQLVSWAQMSARLFNQKQNNPDNIGWHLYHFGDESIDLAELFFWADIEHSVFHTSDWRTILVQPGNFFKCREISLSGL
jgi:hypothetical protein